LGTQQLDYPLLENQLPPYEPRGCQRGISFSWVFIQPDSDQIPIDQSALIDAYREEKAKTDIHWKHGHLAANPEKRKNTKMPEVSGFRRATGDEVIGNIWRSHIYTAKEHCPDRVIGFFTIPAMSMLSYAGGVVS
jgi:nitrate reductase alpha subunit